MKQGRTLAQLAAELQRRAANKKDYIAPTKALVMEEDGQHLAVAEEGFGIDPLAHSQLAEYTAIPTKYYQRMQEQDPQLLSKNVNRWLSATKEDRMVRTLDGNVRAFLSSRYRPLENEDLANSILPILLDGDQYDLHSCEITSSRLYLKVVGKAFNRELEKTGNFLGDGGHRIVKDILFPAMVITNSEVGLGSLSISRATYTGGCSNLCIHGEKSMRRYHVGARHDILPDDLVAILSDETRRLTDAAIWSQVRDVVRGGFDKDRFNELVDSLEGAEAQKIDKTADVVKVVKLASTKLGINDTEQHGILQALVTGGDLSRYGLSNAITRYSQDVENYDRATELERAGAQLIELPKTDWEQIALAS